MSRADTEPMSLKREVVAAHSREWRDREGEGGRGKACPSGHEGGGLGSVIKGRKTNHVSKPKELEQYI